MVQLPLRTLHEAVVLQVWCRGECRLSLIRLNLQVVSGVIPMV